MNTLTKAALAKALIDELNFPKDDALTFVDDFFKEARLALESGKNLKLSSFGNFMLSDKNPRPGRNPKTGEDVEISARRVVAFKGGQKLKHLIESNTAIIEQNKKD